MKPNSIIGYPLRIVAKFKENISSIGLYILASIIPFVINLSINPILSLSLNPYDFSIIGFYSSFSNFLSPLISFYAYGYYAKRFYEVKDDFSRNILKSTIFRCLIYFSTVLSIVSILAVFVYVTFFNEKSDIPFFPHALISIFSIPFTGIYTLKLVDLKMNRNVKTYFKFCVVYGLLMATITLVLVVTFKLGAFGKFSASLILSFFVFLYLVYSERELFKYSFDWREFISMLKFVWPLILGSMLHFFTSGFDIVYLEKLNNSYELGFYVVAFQIVGYISVLQNSLNNTFQPDFYKSVIEKKYSTAAKYIIFIWFFLALFLVIFYFLAPYLIEILTAGRYNDALKYVRILCISQMTMAFYFTSTEIFIIRGYSLLALVSKIIGVIISIIAFSLLISKWRYIGAAWGVSISFIILTIVNILFLWASRQTSKKYT